MEETVSIKANVSRAQVQALDRATFEELYRIFLPKVYNYICYKINDRNVAEDITSEVFERALTRLDTYRADRGAFSTWLFRIAHNLVANHLRTIRRHPETYSLEASALEPIMGSSPEQTAIEAERLGRVGAYIQRLPEAQQEVVALKFGWGLSNQEIAHAMKLNANHVGVLLYRAVRSLRLALEGEEASR
jgi:RNA polymerase sigma factor (sigma-70 family)